MEFPVWVYRLRVDCIRLAVECLRVCRVDFRQDNLQVFRAVRLTDSLACRGIILLAGADQLARRIRFHFHHHPVDGIRVIRPVFRDGVIIRRNKVRHRYRLVTTTHSRNAVVVAKVAYRRRYYRDSGITSG